MRTITLALDAMGGDHGVNVVVPAAILALNKYVDLKVILVGDEVAIKQTLQKQKALDNERLSIFHTDEVVGMDELPSHALRNKKNSSMRKALDLVKEGKADGCVSAGNTGALMATARFVLKMLPGIDRPAIVSELPTLTGKTRVLDLGANVDSCAEHLFQFAVMGNVLTQASDNIEHPRVGLLNIGVEEIKGNDQVKRTAHILNDYKEINYIGFVEGDDIYSGAVDVVVCDGFVGNVALKASEGIAKVLFGFVKQAFQKNLFNKCLALLVKPVLKSIHKRMDPAQYNGASLLGINGIVVKSHGGTNIIGFRHAIEEAIVEVKSNVPDLIREQVAELLVV